MRMVGNTLDNCFLRDIVKLKGNTMDTTNIRFLLIQSEIVDVAIRPDTLQYQFVDNISGFQVAIGCIDEAGKPKIMAVVAEVCPMTGVTAWRVSSELDGSNRLIGITCPVKYFVRGRLKIMWQKGLFSDLKQLPQPILVKGIK